MLDYLWNFVKRHKKKFFFVGVLSGGAYILYKYAGWQLAEWKELEAAECLANAKRQHHFDCNQRTCNTTVLSMLPKLREAIQNHVDSESIVKEIKSRPENKVDLWSELKIMSFTRTLVTIYSTTMLTVFMRVQLNVLGGYMYIDSCVEDDETTLKVQAAPDVQQEYLSKVQYLLSDGLTDLTKTVTEAVENVLGKLSLQDSMKLQDLEECLTKLRGQIEVLSSDNDVLLSGNMIHPLSRYMMASESEIQSSCKSASSQDSIHRMMLETRDVIESNDFCLVLNNCLDKAFSRLLDNVAHFFRPSAKAEVNNSEINPYKTQLPLAKVIPMMNAQLFTLCSDAPNQFVQELLLVPCMKDFAANIYEAFSQVRNSGVNP